MSKSKSKNPQPDPPEQQPSPPTDPGADVTTEQQSNPPADPADPGADTPERSTLAVAELLAEVPYSQLKRLAAAVGRVLGEHGFAAAVREVEKKNQPEPRERQTSRPVCPLHKKPMVAEKTEQFFTRYACQVEGCTERRKQPRPMNRHPASPEPDFSAR